ncbi:ABC transporter substrate-binding protein [Arthrobacter ramosus]|uniref:ABC transporter substrate-binding protein n=1 Tax=Arthrobacter ramosus TaxID=1672 RepID=A0ABV5XZQ7_ARTRM|nr:hypothetical protein [Arthrobacter ramosus]
MTRKSLPRHATVASIAIVAVGIALSGCGASGSSSTNANGVTNLKMIMEPGPEADSMSKLVDAFNSGQGAKDKIHVEIDQLSRTDTFAKEAALMSTQSSDYDIYRTTSYLVAQHAPYLEPLTLNGDNYFKAPVESLQVDGKQYGIPLDPSVHLLYYRTDLIDQMLKDAPTYEKISQDVLGKKLEPKSPDQWTWDDYIASAAYFTKKYNPNSPTPYGTQLQAKNLLYNAMVWDDVLWGLGGNWLNSAGQPDLTSTAAQNAVNVYRTVYTKGLTAADSDQAEFPETEAALGSGNAAFAVQWNAGYAQLNDASKSPKTAGKIGIAPVPGGKTHVHALSLGVNKYGKHTSQAQEFIKYLDDPATMGSYVGDGGIASMPKALSTKTDPNTAALNKALSGGSFSEPALPKAFDVYTALANDLSAAWVGQGDVSSALAKANADVAKLAGK